MCCKITLTFTSVIQSIELNYLGPLQGQIPGLDTTFIDFVYTPTTFTRAEAIVRFTTNEFRNEPVLCKLRGDALPSQFDVRAALAKIENRQ